MSIPESADDSNVELFITGDGWAGDEVLPLASPRGEGWAPVADPMVSLVGVDWGALPRGSVLPDDEADEETV